MANSLPYENATSGKAAVDDIHRIVRGFGASSFGLMEDFQAGEIIVQFTWRERHISIKASAKGYAAAWLRYHPYGARTKGTMRDHERRALRQANISVYSILRDWIKGQITAVETGMLSFDGAFLGQIMLPTGETVLDRIKQSDILRVEESRP